MAVIHNVPLTVAQLHLYGQQPVAGLVGSRLHAECGLAVANVLRIDKGVPAVQEVLAREHQRDGAVESGPGIPARTFLHIHKVHFHKVGPRLHVIGDVHPESVIAVGPVTGLLAVDAHCGFGHGTVEQQFGVALEVIRYCNGAAVMALANPGQ